MIKPEPRFCEESLRPRQSADSDWKMRASAGLDSAQGGNAQLYFKRREVSESASSSSTTESTVSDREEEETIRPSLDLSSVAAAPHNSSPNSGEAAERSPATPSFLFDDYDQHIYTHMTMADFSIGDEVEEELPSQLEETEESDSVLHHKQATVREAHEMFVTVFGSCPLNDLKASIAPGRVNLIGEHVDYCDGFVLPMAIPLYTCAMGRRAADQNRGYSLVHSTHFTETVQLHKPYTEGKDKYPQWVRYVQGVFALLEADSLPYLDIVVHSHIPPGSSLSSSAALELSVLYLLMDFLPEVDRLSTTAAALLCQKAEHLYAGMPCGIMDQLVIAAAKNQRALKIDCLTLDYEAIPMSIAHDVVFLVTNSGVKHALATSEYAKRRSDVDRAVKLIGANSWRDVNEELLKQRSASLRGEGDMMDRASHVVGEIARTVEAANALLDNNIILFGRLMTDSHESLRRKYSVSCAELDELVEIALSVEGVFGARMTGGGFGGCTVSMVRRDAVENLKKEIKSRYTGGEASFLECEPVGGVRIFALDFLAPPRPPSLH
ncbi:hypothetical protein PMAYCL1PPCAC_02612 [Pristionchus mayeri]|uniref:Galactokinase n=1 Tax=Pristionchus mayeri TaxID=1317129 RepID=A0AAN5C731_9BILA|nr:hypothetical protein PMAYCL1PPCAC_02612 [Pristionchus mayeri]